MVDLSPQQKFYQKNKNDPLFRQRKLEIMKRYYSVHKEARKIKQREYRKLHLERVRAQDRCRNRAEEQRIYHKAHPEKVRIWRIRRNQKLNPLELQLRARLRRAFGLYSKNGKVKAARQYGVDFTAICQHLGSRPNDGQVWHIDHIVPLSYFDFDDPEQIKVAFAPENHQWLLAKENLRKGNRWIG